MNKWRHAFFLLLSLVILAIFGLILYVTIPADDYVSYESAEPLMARGNSVTVRTTKADFEGIANMYIRRAMASQQLPLVLSVENDVSLSSELKVFSATVPILMKFEPLVQKDGNLLLEQKSVEVGMLDIPPEAALKLLRDSVDLPPFMEVMPAEEEILLRLTDIPLNNGMTVQASSFNLEENDIRLKVTIQH